VYWLAVPRLVPHCHHKAKNWGHHRVNGSPAEIPSVWEPERQKEAKEFYATVTADKRKAVRSASSGSPTVSEAAEAWIKRVEADKLSNINGIRKL